MVRSFACVIVLLLLGAQAMSSVTPSVAAAERAAVATAAERAAVAAAAERAPVAMAAQETARPGAPTAGGPARKAAAVDDSARLVAPPESLYVVLLDTGPAFRIGLTPDRQPGFAGHAAYMRSLSVAGTLVLGGPYGDDPGHMVLSGAFLLLRAPSLADARRIAGVDPGIQGGLMRLRLVARWVPASGVLVRALTSPHEGR